MPGQHFLLRGQPVVNLVAGPTATVAVLRVRQSFDLLPQRLGALLVVIHVALPSFALHRSTGNRCTTVT